MSEVIRLEVSEKSSSQTYDSDSTVEDLLAEVFPSAVEQMCSLRANSITCPFSFGLIPGPPPTFLVITAQNIVQRSQEEMALFMLALGKQDQMGLLVYFEWQQKRRLNMEKLMSVLEQAFQRVEESREVRDFFFINKKGKSKMWDSKDKARKQSTNVWLGRLVSQFNFKKGVGKCLQTIKILKEGWTQSFLSQQVQLMGRTINSNAQLIDRNRKFFTQRLKQLQMWEEQALQHSDQDLEAGLLSLCDKLRKYQERFESVSRETRLHYQWLVDRFHRIHQWRQGILTAIRNAQNALEYSRIQKQMLNEASRFQSGWSMLTKRVRALLRESNQQARESVELVDWTVKESQFY